MSSLFKMNRKSHKVKHCRSLLKLFYLKIIDFLNFALLELQRLKRYVEEEMGGGAMQIYIVREPGRNLKEEDPWGPACSQYHATGAPSQERRNPV